MLFCGLERHEMENLIKHLSHQKKAQYRSLYNSADSQRLADVRELVADSERKNAEYNSRNAC